MKDFIAQEITVGCFLARGGKGNGPAEYGMILHKVIGLKNGKIQTMRLVASYPQFKDPATITTRKITIANPNSVVVVTPPTELVELFDRAVNSTLSDADQLLIGHWIHGADFQRPWK